MEATKLNEKRVVRSPDGSCVLTLAKPVTSAGGVRLETLKFREAIAEDLDALEKGQRMLIARLTNQDVDTVGKLCLYDFMQAKAVVESFFDEPRPLPTASQSSLT